MKITKQKVLAAVGNIIYFQCPACQTKALVDVDNEVRSLLDVDYQDRFVCEECGEEFLGEIGYDMKPEFTRITDDIESATNTCGIAARPDQLKKPEDEVVSAATPPYRKREIIKSLQDKLINRCAKWFRDDFGHMNDSELAEFLPELGYNDLNDMFVVEVTLEDDGRIRAEVRAELSYDGLYDLGEACNPIVQKYDKEAYFDMDQPGIMSAYLDLDGVYGSVTNKINASTRSFEDWLYCKGVPVGEELSDDEYNSYYDQYEEELELMKDSVMSADRSGIHNIDSDVYAYLEELGDYLDNDYWAKVDALMDEFEISSPDAQFYIYNFSSGKYKQSDPQSEYEYRKNVYLKRKHEFETLGEDDNNDVLSREEKMNIAKAEMDKVNPKSVKSAKYATFKNDKRLSTSNDYINSATGANYGGAYDIDPESYFTREDLDELGYSVAELVSLDLDDTVEYAGAWIEPNNELTVELKSADYDSSVTLKVDMRKIRRPQDLTAKYAQKIANESLKQFKDWYQDEEVINSSEAIDAQYRSWYEPDDDDYIDVDEVEDVVEIDLDGTQVRISPDRLDDFVDKEHEWAKYVDIEIPDFNTWITIPSYQIEDDVWSMITDMLPETTNEEKVYTLYGEVRLCYRVSNVFAEELDPIREPEGDYGYNYETYTDDAEIEFIRDKSQVVSLRVE